jgi:hypothetical protein
MWAVGCGLVWAVGCRLSAVGCTEATVVRSFRRLSSCRCESLFVGVEQSTFVLLQLSAWSCQVGAGAVAEDATI